MSGRHLLASALVTVVFTGLARAMHGVSRSGAAAGATVCFILYACAGPGAFLVLVLVFLLTLLATRWRYSRKQRLGTAEKRDGRRASQVIANVGAAAACALAYAASGQTGFLLAMSAALSEAAADTVSSEAGQAATQTPRLITNWKTVGAGTNGAVSPFGTAAGVLAAVLVGGACVAAGLIPLRQFGPALTAAVAGMMADSYMGALLESRGLLNNDAVNFLSTLIAAGLAFFFA